MSHSLMQPAPGTGVRTLSWTVSQLRTKLHMKGMSAWRCLALIREDTPAVITLLMALTISRQENTKSLITELRVLSKSR